MLGNALVRFRDACQRDEFIVAAFVGGSIAAKMADDESDVDLYAVTLQPDDERFFTRRQAFMRTWARPLVLVDKLSFEGLGFDMLHFVLDDGVYVELALGHAGNIQFRKQLHRGHSVAAANLLARLRTHCASLLALARAEDLDLEVELLNDRLSASVDSGDPSCTARAIARFHQEIGPAIATDFGVGYPSDVAQLLSSDLAIALTA
jgi:hypothetical protein